MTGAEATWRATAALRRALVLGVGGLAGGLALGLPELAVLSVPFLLHGALALRPRPRVAAAVVVHAPRTAAVDEPVDVALTVPAAPGGDLAVVRTPDGPLALALPERGARRLTSSVVPTTWGRRTLARADTLLAAADAHLLVGPTQGQVRDVLVVPAVPPAAAGPLPPHATTVVGAHRTRRTGDGSDLHTVDAFRPGDRLRHVDWKATARRGQHPGGLRLHVRRTSVDADGDVVLLLDTRGDLGTDVATWSVPAVLQGGAVAPGSSLDLTVTTAAGLAAAHLEAGDRVGTVDLTVPAASVRRGAGRRHLRRLRAALAGTAASGTAVGGRAGYAGGPLPRRLLEQAPARALVVLLSPFLDDRVADLALALARHGRAVVGVDCLPGGLRPDRSSALGPLALRLVLAEREARLAALRAAGVPVLAADADLPAATRRLVRDRIRAAAR
ncbi:DUF58 domain-containing protein [Aquipuribacter nitratireducens]|uniref:DUF58 domain-containing protein n=1 Tax=Aquipuribacter nitratireducens TaxID=650104 RepID=A0ABW0GJ53_9MICO